MQRELGQRVRALRNQKRYSQRQLAAAAGVGQRFLVKVEGGEANPSIAFVAALAGALGVTMSRLFEGIGPNTQPSIALVGLRGAGKSTVGPLLAHQMACPFVELGRRIEEAAGMSLADVFEFHGIQRYRTLARKALDEILEEPGHVVLEVGGSLVLDEELYALLRERCTVVWLKASPEEHLRRVREQGDLRPMQGRADALGELRDILDAREPLYALADRHVDTAHVGILGAVEAITGEPVPAEYVSNPELFYGRARR